MRRAVVTVGAVVLISLSAQAVFAQAESQPTPPFEPSADDLACTEDADCLLTCDFGAYGCCPTYCAPCTFTLNREAMQRRRAQCDATLFECPTVGACSGEPIDGSVVHCVEGSCSVEIIPVEATAPPAP